MYKMPFEAMCRETFLFHSTLNNCCSTASIIHSIPQDCSMLQIAVLCCLDSECCHLTLFAGMPIQRNLLLLYIEEKVKSATKRINAQKRSNAMPSMERMPSNNRRGCLQKGGSFTAYCGCCRPAERHRGSKPYREEGHLQRHDSPQQLVGNDIL